MASMMGLIILYIDREIRDNQDDEIRLVWGIGFIRFHSCELGFPLRFRRSLSFHFWLVFIRVCVLRGCPISFPLLSGF
jgi:hypothetical protein